MSAYGTHDQNQSGEDTVGELYNPYDPPKKRPSSIDLALELEHQLGSESAPTTPANPLGGNIRPQSLDPHILASIVMQLRHSLSEMTKERDELQHMLSVATSQAADVKDTLQYMEEKCMKLEEELDDAKKRMADDETAISMLRSKVEESRRGLMRLQAESKQTRRQSQMSMSVDLSRAGVPSFGGPSSGKRASFTPLTGSSYPRHLGRASSVSIPDSSLPVDGLPLSPPMQTLSLPDGNGVPPGGHPPPPPPGSLRFSGLLGRTSPDPSAQGASGNTVEVDALRRELKALKDELEDTRHELIESNEAREASETCVKALRDFIGENNVGGDHSVVDRNSPSPMKLPPPPHMAKSDEADTRSRNGSISSWGFKLWTGGAGAVRPSNSGSSASSQPNSTPQPPQAAFSKFGGFFSAKPSSSSTTTTSSTQASQQQEPTYNGSDTSSVIESVAEPISPTNEMPSSSVLVRGDNLTGSQSSSELDGLGGDTDQVKSLNGDGKAIDVLSR